MLFDNPAVKQSSYRKAVAGIIRTIKQRNEESNQDVADRLGCSPTTIANAENEKGNLDPVTLLRIGQEYGHDMLGPVASLIGGKFAPKDAMCTSDKDMPVPVAKAQLFLAHALADNGKVDDHELLELGAPEAIEQAGQVFDTLRWRLNSLQARGMRA